MKTTLLLLSLSGCATVVDGYTQTVAIRTAPQGAVCAVSRAGAPLGTAPLGTVLTPGSLLVRRSRDDLVVACEKPGWAPAITVLRSKFTAVTVGNVVAGGPYGLVLDGATGADFLYDDTDRIILMTPAARASAERPDPAAAVPAVPPQRT